MNKNKISKIAKEVINFELDALKHLKKNINNNFIEIVKMILSCKGGKIIISGVGKSGIIAKKWAATFSSTGTPSFFLDALNASHGDLGQVTSNDIVILLSNSGQSDELNNIIQYVSRNKNIKLIGITSKKESVLYKNSDLVFPLVSENLKMKKALKVIDDKKLGVLIARNKYGNTSGIITDGDLKRIAQKFPDFGNLNLKKVMKKNPLSVSRDTLAATALSIMNSKKITSLCVHKKNKIKKTIGLIHVHDILKSNIS